LEKQQSAFYLEQKKQQFYIVKKMGDSEMKKRSIMLLAMIFFLISAITGATMAWLSYEAPPVMNTFEVGTVKIELYDELGGVDFPEAGISNVNPGDAYDKEVWVKSLGSKKTYLRVLVTPKWISAAGSVLPIKNKIADTVTMNLGTDWIAGPTGENPTTGGQWYYYKYMLDKNEVTTKLLDGVIFSGPAIGNEYQGATFTIDVYAEAVQASYEAFLYEWGIAGAFGTSHKVPVAGVEEWAP
jgi:hypothetical protein